MNNNDLLERARRQAAQPFSQWGWRVALDPGDSFVGRWRGQTTDTDNDDRPIYLLWGENNEACFIRHYAALGRAIEAEQPEVGDRVAIHRGDDYQSQNGTGYAFGIASEPCTEPIPDHDGSGTAGTADLTLPDEDIPF